VTDGIRRQSRTERPGWESVGSILDRLARRAPAADELDAATLFVWRAARRAGLIRPLDSGAAVWASIDRLVERATGRSADSLSATDWILLGLSFEAAARLERAA
jgi:hypothetical protein